MMRTLRPVPIRAPILALAVGLILGACGPSATPPASPASAAPSAPGASSPAVSPIGSPPASVAPGPTSITSPEAAAAVVLASDARFAGLTAKDPGMIGQCCFYTVLPAADGFTVTIEIGWGDCPAGCIDRHHWFYAVRTDGTFRLDREDGPPVLTE